MRTVHKLKIDDFYYDQIIGGDKNFEVRYNDRGYQKDDHIQFLEEDGAFGREGLWKINYVHSGLGLKEMFVVLAIERIDK